MFWRRFLKGWPNQAAAHRQICPNLPVKEEHYWNPLLIFVRFCPNFLGMQIDSLANTHLIFTTLTQLFWHWEGFVWQKSLKKRKCFTIENIKKLISPKNIVKTFIFLHKSIVWDINISKIIVLTTDHFIFLDVPSQAMWYISKFPAVDAHTMWKITAWSLI